jgi:PRTRC genetic system protein B
MWFKCSDKKIGVRNGLTPQPGLVFAAGICGWRVFAVKGNARPTPDTQLCLAPHFNVWKDGRVCEGSVDVPKSCGLDNLTEWEKAYFDSEFCHPNVHKDLVKFRGGSYSFWKSMLDGKFGTFPDKVLVPAGLTLNDFLKQTVGGGK